MSSEDNGVPASGSDDATAVLARHPAEAMPVLAALTNTGESVESPFLR